VRGWGGLLGFPRILFFERLIEFHLVCYGQFQSLGASFGFCTMFNLFNRKKSENPAKARALHQEARELGSANALDAAIKKLLKAIALDPKWAYPSFDLAYIYYFQGNIALALEYFRKIDDLEPEGFLTTKVAIYTLQGELTGKFPGGTYYRYIQIDRAASEEIAAAKGLVRDIPEYAPGWEMLAGKLENTEERMEAIEKGLALRPDPETMGMLLLNKALVLNATGKVSEAKALLDEMIIDPKTTSNNRAFAHGIIVANHS
jgi:tetratricopeptide (TPR) repeat protein